MQKLKMIYAKKGNMQVGKGAGRDENAEPRVVTISVAYNPPHHRLDITYGELIQYVAFNGAKFAGPTNEMDSSELVPINYRTILVCKQGHRFPFVMKNGMHVTCGGCTVANTMSPIYSYLNAEDDEYDGKRQVYTCKVGHQLLLRQAHILFSECVICAWIRDHPKYSHIKWDLGNIYIKGATHLRFTCDKCNAVSVTDLHQCNRLKTSLCCKRQHAYCQPVFDTILAAELCYQVRFTDQFSPISFTAYSHSLRIGFIHTEDKKSLCCNKPIDVDAVAQREGIKIKVVEGNARSIISALMPPAVLTRYKFWQHSGMMLPMK